MEPIELEMIMRNSTKGVLAEIATDVDSLQNIFFKTGTAIQSRIDLLSNSLKGLGNDLDNLADKFANSLSAEGYIDQIAQISVLRQEVELLSNSLSNLNQQHKTTMDQPSATGTVKKDRVEKLPATDVLLEGVDQLTDTLSSGVDILTLFTDENERLEQVQRSLQAVMIITNGLKSVSVLLDKESAFQTTIVAGAKNLLTAATSRLAVALGISTVAAQALMTTLTLGLSAAITAIIVLWEKYSGAQNEAKQKQEEAAAAAVKQKEADEELQKAAAETVATQLVEYKKLQAQYQALGKDLQAKKKFVDENQEAFRKLGVSVSTVGEAENLLLDNEGAFVTSLQRKALAAAAMDLAAEKYKKALRKMVEAEKYEATNEDKADAKVVADKWKSDYVSKHGYTKQNKQFVDNEYQAQYKHALSILTGSRKAEIYNEGKEFQDQGDTDILAGVKLSADANGKLKDANIKSSVNKKRSHSNDTDQKKVDLEEAVNASALKAQEQLENMKTEFAEVKGGTRLEILKREHDAINANIEAEAERRKKERAEAETAGVKTTVTEGSIDKDATALKDQNTALYKKKEKEIKDEDAQKETQELKQEFQNLVDQRKEVKESTQAKITKMKDANTNASKNGEKEVYSQATIKEAEKQQTEALAEIDDKIQGTTSAMSQAFADMSGKTSKEMRAIANEAEAMYNAVKNGEYKKEPGDDAETQKKKNHGLTEEQFTTLKNDPEQMAKLGNQVKAVNSQADKAQNAFQKMGSGMKKVFSAGNDAEKLKEGISEIGEGFAAASAIGQQFSGTLSSIGELSGNEKFSEVGNTLSGAMDVANSAMSGAQAGAALGPMGAAAGAAMGLISSITEKFAGIKKANKELAEKMEKDQMNSYLSELEMNRVYRERYEWAQKIGESTVSHLKRGGTELKKQTTDNAAEQEELWAKLAGLEYESGSHVTKNFWGKKKEVKEYDSLAGKSWEEIERLANDNKLSDEGMKYFEALKSARQEGEDLAKRQEEWLESAKEFYTGTTVEGVANGIVEGFLQGKRSAADFSESFENMMRDSMTNALKDSMTEDVTKWRDEYYALANDEDGLTEKDIAYLREKYNAIIEKQSAEADELEKVTGIDLNANQQQQAGGGGGFTTMTQEQGTKLEGLFTSLQDHTISIDDKMTDISSVMYDSFNALTQIASNTNYCRHLETMASDIAEMKRDGIKMK